MRKGKKTSNTNKQHKSCIIAGDKKRNKNRETIKAKAFKETRERKLNDYICKNQKVII